MALIRKMQTEDIAQVQDVARKSWNATYEGIIPFEIQEKFLKMAYNDESMKQRLDRSFLFVAEIESDIIGFANFSPVNDEGIAELGAIYLSPEHQGKGIGSALLQKGINELEGIKEVYINVEKDNKIGKSFYDAKGFQVVREFDDQFDGHTLKTVRMVLTV